MVEPVRSNLPVVSVVITCYNQAAYLSMAIESVLQQTHQRIELIVVDDGSTDHTWKVAKAYPTVRYTYQANAGLSAARNKGIAESTGEYLVFLDADDYLYEHAVATNLKYLAADPALAFAAGWHDKVDAQGRLLDREDAQPQLVVCEHYHHFLQGNFVGMHGAVMYRRWAFAEVQFDTQLRACEDYEVFLRLTRRLPMIFHHERIAVYRFHDANMSANVVRMLQHVKAVLRRQIPLLKNQTERKAYSAGISNWRTYYAKKLFNALWRGIDDGDPWPRPAELSLLAAAIPGKLVAFVRKKLRTQIRTWLKKRLPDHALKQLHHHGLYHQYTPPPGKVKLGDFNRLVPFSDDFGFDRGGAVDRFYIESFLRMNAGHVQGTVLEIGDNTYTVKFGAGRIGRSEVLHVDRTNTGATYIGDITNIPQIPSGHFDCIIFTQTLHLIYDFTSALRTCYRILKPGGCLLLTVPGISHIDRGLWKDHWLWSFTDTAMQRLMKDTFNGSQVDIRTYGNVQVASAFLYGMGLPEIPRQALLHHDPGYQLIVSVKAIKHGGYVETLE